MKLQAVQLSFKGDCMTSKKQMILRVIGAKVVYYRTLQNIRQEELAARINMSKRTLSRIEHGSSGKIISMSELWDIATGLKIDLVNLLKFDEFEKAICI